MYLSLYATNDFIGPRASPFVASPVAAQLSAPRRPSPVPFRRGSAIPWMAPADNLGQLVMAPAMCCDGAPCAITIRVNRWLVVGWWSLVGEWLGNKCDNIKLYPTNICDNIMDDV